MTVEMICKLVPCGYWVVCKRFTSGHRAGYVGIPDSHPLYGRNVDWPVLRQFNTALGRPGYAAGRLGGWEGHPRNESVWWIGIDNLFEEPPEDTMTDVLRACFQLARQLENYERRRACDPET